MGFFKGFAGGLSQGMASPNDPFSQILSERQRNEDLLLQQTMASGDWRVMRDKYLEMGFKEDEIMPLIMHLQKQEIMKLPEPQLTAQPDPLTGEYDPLVTGEIETREGVDFVGDYYAKAYHDAMPFLEERFDIVAERDADKIEQENARKWLKYQNDRRFENEMEEHEAEMKRINNAHPDEGTIVDPKNGTGWGYMSKSGRLVKLRGPSVSTLVGEDNLKRLQDGVIDPFKLLPTVMTDVRSRFEKVGGVPPAIEAQIEHDIMQYALKAPLGTKAETDNTALLQMMNSMNSGLRILDENFDEIKDYVGKWGPEKQALEAWSLAYSEKRTMYNADDDIPAAIHQLLTEIGMTTDQIGRLRTGAAITAEEREFFQGILGSIEDGPAVLKSHMQAFYKHLQEQRKTLFEGALSNRYGLEHDKVTELMDFFQAKPMYQTKVTEEEQAARDLTEKIQAWKKGDDISILLEGVDEGQIGRSTANEWLENGDISQEEYDMLFPPPEELDPNIMQSLMSTSAGLPPSPNMPIPHSGPSRRPTGTAKTPTQLLTPTGGRIGAGMRGKTGSPRSDGMASTSVAQNLKRMQ